MQHASRLKDRPSTGDHRKRLLKDRKKVLTLSCKTGLVFCFLQLTQELVVRDLIILEVVAALVHGVYVSGEGVARNRATLDEHGRAVQLNRFKHKLKPPKTKRFET